MLWFDILCVSFAFISYFLVTRTHGAKIVALQFVLQFFIDVMFIDLHLYLFVSQWYFYLTKGLVLTATIICLLKHYHPHYIVLLLFATMLYQFGLWWEEITFIYNTGIFNRYFLPYMVVNSAIQIAFLAGSIHVKRITQLTDNRIARGLGFNRNRNTDLRASYINIGGAC